jgi:hypothetical protein
VNHDTEALTAAAQQVVADAKRLGLVWTMQNGTVTSTNPIKVQMDGDAVSILVTSMVGVVSLKQRVYIIQVPPAGNFIVGTVNLSKVSDGSWASMTLLNGWTNVGSAEVTAQYRLVPSPPNTLQIVGEIVAGTITDGTVIANLNDGFRPIHSVTFPLACNPTNRAAVLRMTSAGDLTIFGLVAGTVQIYFNTLIPLDA